MYKCQRCDETYETLEGNFHRNASTTRGFHYICKHCVSVYQKLRPKQREEATRRLNAARNAPSITKRKAESIAIKIANYERRLRWQEKPYVITDIKLCEI